MRGSKICILAVFSWGAAPRFEPQFFRMHFATHNIVRLRLAIRVTPPHPKNRKHGMRIPHSYSSNSSFLCIIPILNCTLREGLLNHINNFYRKAIFIQSREGYI
jgi:hypothetical protein